MDIDESVADRAHQMVVGSAAVGVVACGAVADPQLEHLPHLDQFPKRVVDGGQGHLGQDGASPFQNVVGREVHVIAGEDLSDGAPLGRDPPATGTEAFEERRCGSHAAHSRGHATRTPIFVWLLTRCYSEIRTLPTWPRQNGEPTCLTAAKARAQPFPPRLPSPIGPGRTATGGRISWICRFCTSTRACPTRWTTISTTHKRSRASTSTR